MYKLWVAFGTATSWHIPVHDITRSLSKSIALPMFYAYTGCDTVLSFGTEGKQTAWITRMNNEEVTPTFLALSAEPAHIKDNDIGALEPCSMFALAALTMLIKLPRIIHEEGKSNPIPPTKTALVHNIKRAVYQGRHCWGKMLQVSLNMSTHDKGIQPLEATSVNHTTWVKCCIGELFHCWVQKCVQDDVNVRKLH